MVDPTAHSGPSTSTSLARSKAFLLDRLQPDLKAAQVDVTVLQGERDEWVTTLEALHDVVSTKGKGREIVDLGDGVLMEVDFDAQLVPIVNLGLAGSDLFASLTPEQGVEHCKRKIKLIDARIVKAEEKVATIEAHILLAATSIAQLEALHTGEQESFLDGLVVPSAETSS